MKEHPIQQRILLACGRGLTRLFRNNTGVAWAGKGEPIRTTGQPKQVTLYPGDVLIRAAQPIKYGLCVGSSDLIGWKTVTVTADMVGRRVAVFAAIEVKSSTGRATDDQKRFVASVRAAGGLAGVARSEAEAAAILSDERLTDVSEV